MKKPLTDMDFASGEMLLIDKPYGNTSFGIVAQLKKWTKAKIGHAGTLDPLASGLVICCTGKSTKLLTGLIGLDKEYTGSFCLGYTTPTYDLESVPENPIDISHIKEEDIIAASKTFIGTIKQTPPIHSAIKQEGKPVYELARQGKEVELKSRSITIESFEITRITLPEVFFKVRCSSGTYLRTLAFDMGKTLACGAFLSSLRRTQIGEHRIEDAYTLEEMRAYFGTSMNLKRIEPKEFSPTTAI